MKKVLYLIVIVFVSAFVFIYFNFDFKKEIIDEVEEVPTVAVVTLSQDKKDILINGNVALSVDEENIFNFFKGEKAQMCDMANINNTETRKAFCSDKNFFKQSVRFQKVVTSSTGGKIAFVLETNELPDTVVGMFYPMNNTYKVHIITNYYLGNDVMSFSPNDKYIAVRDRCFEGNCGFVIKDSATLENIKSFGLVEEGPSYTFIKWISGDEIEYKIGDTSATINI